MIDLHTHTWLSDGVLGPAEQIRFAEVKGYRILGITDHADLATIERQLAVIRETARVENELEGPLLVLAGVELTHVRPRHMERAANLARKHGAEIVLAHGETLAEPVMPGTNRAAIEAGVDILAHPGLITEEEAALAAKRNVFLEISGKAGHSLANGHVARMAGRTGARLIFGSDSHQPAQFPTRAEAERIVRAAGLDAEEAAAMFARAERFARHKSLQAEMEVTDDW